MAANVIRDLLDQAFPEGRSTSRTAPAAATTSRSLIVSAAFNGLPLIQQHKLVNAALAAPLADGTIHELRIRTKGTA